MWGKMAGRFCVTFCIAAAILFTCLAVSEAEIMNENLPQREGVKVGEILVHSALATILRYESNIFLSQNDTKSDLITVINPSFGMKMPLRENAFSIEYDAFINMYQHHSKENHTDHRINALGEIKLTDYTIALSDLFRRFTNRRDSEVTARIRQQTNEARIGVSTEREQLGFDVGYTNRINDYRSNDIVFGSVTYDDRDYMAHILDAAVRYRFLPKTSVLFETDYGVINYDNSVSPDAKFIELLAGLLGNPHQNLSLNIKGGVKHQDYDQSALLNDESFTGFVVRGGADYEMTKDDRLSLKVERDIYESTYQNMNYYTLNAIGLDYRHLFNEKLSGSIFGSYQFNKYPDDSTEGGVTQKREDDFYSAGVKTTYAIRKWLTVGLEYAYTRRNSNFANYDYKDHVAMFSVTAGF